MGANQSGGVEIAGSSMGYQVLRVYPNSPGSRAGLKAYFDFIIAIGNTRFNAENGSLREILKASVEQKLKMIVFNTRTKSTREVEIIPSTNWGGNGLLGVSIKHSSFDKADERVWHVVDVEPGSPAQQAGFKASEDYVIGSDSILQENDDLYNLIEAHDGKALKLFVYNIGTDNCREVICHPNSRWGGKGFLGCEFGHGLLHRIPYGIGEGGDMSDNSRLPLLRNEQPFAAQELPKPAPSNLLNNQQSPDNSYGQSRPITNPMQTEENNLFNKQGQVIQQQSPTQPGQQLLHQALFDYQPSQHQHQQQHIQQAPATQQSHQIPTMLPAQQPGPPMYQSQTMSQPYNGAPMQQTPQGPSMHQQQMQQGPPMQQQHQHQQTLSMQQQAYQTPAMYQAQPSPNLPQTYHQFPSMPPQQSPPPQQQQQQQQQTYLPTPQTFAQLANTQFQTQHYQPPPTAPAQVQQQQQPTS